MIERKTSYGYEDLLKCARGELFGPGNAQLPAPPMLMVRPHYRSQRRMRDTWQGP